MRIIIICFINLNKKINNMKGESVDENSNLD